jgi:hypothetical protein
MQTFTEMNEWRATVRWNATLRQGLSITGVWRNIRQMRTTDDMKTAFLQFHTILTTFWSNEILWKSPEWGQLIINYKHSVECSSVITDLTVMLTSYNELDKLNVSLLLKIRLESQNIKGIGPNQQLYKRNLQKSEILQITRAERGEVYWWRHHEFRRIIWISNLNASVDTRQRKAEEFSPSKMFLPYFPSLDEYCKLR